MPLAALEQGIPDIQGMPDIRATIAQAQRVGFEFLRSDLELAFALLERAAITKDPTTATRSMKGAIQAYRAVSRIMRHATLDSRERTELQTTLARLRACLHDMLARAEGLAPANTSDAPIS
jgi:hypothetical protein